MQNNNEPSNNQYPQNNTHDPLPPLDVVLAEELRFPEEDPGFVSADVWEGEIRLEFSSEPSTSIAVGDIVAGSSGNGFLRRVEHVERHGNEVVIHTSQASLTDAVKQGRLSIEISANPSDARVQELSVPIDFRQEVVDGAGVFLEGDVLLDIGATFELDIVDWEVKRADVLLHPAYSHQISIVGDWEHMLHSFGETDLADKLPNIPFAFALGPLPVVGKLKLGVTVGLNVATYGAVNMSATSSVQASGSIGMLYRDGQWESVRDWHGQATTTGLAGEPPTSATVTGYVRPEATIEFYGVGGPVFTIERALTLEIEHDRYADCTDWSLTDSYSTDASFNASVSVPVLGKVFNIEHTITATEESAEIDTGNYGECPCMSSHGQVCCDESYETVCRVYEDDYVTPLTCGPDNICRTGLHGDPCSEDFQCGEELFCGPLGVCTYGQYGSPCVEDDHCRFERGVCARGYCVGSYTMSGVPCESDETCGLNSNCIQGHCHSGGRGSLCESDEHCTAVSLYCSPNGICTERTGVSPCVNDEQCDGAICGPHGYCQAGERGHPCENGSHCKSGNCGSRGTCIGSTTCVGSGCSSDTRFCDSVTGECLTICNQTTLQMSSCDYCGPTGACYQHQWQTLGYACESHSHCHSSSPKCGPREVCQRGQLRDLCENDAHCDGPEFQCSPRGMCERPTATHWQAFGRPGDPCNVSWGELWSCNPNNTICIEEFGHCMYKGEYCNSDDDCEQSLCNLDTNMCWQGLPGTPCNEEDDCGHHVSCLEGVCKGISTGTPCTTNEGCIYMVCGPLGTCQLGTGGSPCTSDSHCFQLDEQSGEWTYYCDLEVGVCRAKED